MRQRGMSLVEILIVIVLAAIVGSLIVNMFITSNRTFMDQGKILDAQRGGRVSMDAMVRLLREARLDPTKDAGAKILMATATSIQFTRDENLSGSIGDGVAEKVEFEFVGGTLRRRFDGGSWVDMADNVSGFSLRYFDADGVDIGLPGADVNQLAKIQSLEVSVAFQDTKTAGGDFVRGYTTRINFRNQ